MMILAVSRVSKHTLLRALARESLVVTWEALLKSILQQTAHGFSEQNCFKQTLMQILFSQLSSILHQGLNFKLKLAT